MLNPALGQRVNGILPVPLIPVFLQYVYALALQNSGASSHASLTSALCYFNPEPSNHSSFS